MIKYEGILKVTAHEFYETMLKQICADVNDKIKKDLTVEQISKGYKYRVTKTQGKKSVESTINVHAPVLDKKISVSNFSQNVLFTMTYEIEALEPELTKVTYIQETTNDKNEGKLTQWLLQRNTKKRFKAFEKYILSNRNK